MQVIHKCSIRSLHLSTRHQGVRRQLSADRTHKLYRIFGLKLVQSGRRPYQHSSDKILYWCIQPLTMSTIAYADSEMFTPDYNGRARACLGGLISEHSLADCRGNSLEALEG